MNGQHEQGRSDWRSLAADLEERVDGLTAGLQEVRLLVRRLAQAAQDEPLPQVTPTQVTYPDANALRDEVRRAVAMARAELEAGAFKHEDLGLPYQPVHPFDEPSPAPPSEPIEAETPGDGHIHFGLPAAAASQATSVPQVPDEHPFDEPSHQPASEPSEAGMFGDGHIHFGPPPASAAPATMSELEASDPRDDVRRMVEQARAELAASGVHESEAPGPQPIEPDRPVEMVMSSQEAPVDTSDGPPDDQRDEVRRAVEEARAELGMGRFRLADSAAPFNEAGFSAPSRWANEPSQPTLVVIEDNGGHIELAKVYETLSRLGCGAKAVLINHTPHSVSLSFATPDDIPAHEAMAAEVKSVFGRECQVVVEGSRISVRIAGSSQGPGLRVSA